MSRTVSRCASIAGVAGFTGFALVAAPLAHADRYWVTNGNGLFSDTSHWSTSDGGASGASVPDLTQPTFFQLSGASPYTVSFQTNGGSSSVTVLNNQLTLDTVDGLNAYEYAVGNDTTTGHHIVVDSSGVSSSLLKLSEGTIRVANIPTSATGTTVSNWVAIHGATGSGGAILRIDGANSTLWGGQLTVGGGGVGAPPAGVNTDAANTRLEVLNGGKANFISSTYAGGVIGHGGTIVVDGSGSQMSVYDETVGGNATASLTLTNGGKFTLNSPGTSLGTGGFINGGLGTVNIDSTSIMEIKTATVTSKITNRNEIRDAGTIRSFNNSTGSATFTNIADRPNNQIGKFRPGDTSATPAVGTATFFNMVFDNQTDSSNPSDVRRAQLFFDLAAPGSYDQILLTGGPGLRSPAAMLLGGTVVLTDPVGGIDFHSRTTMNLIIGEDIVDNGYTNNLASISADWTFNGQPLDTPPTLSIVTLTSGPFAGDKALQILVVPEPATAMLIAPAAVMLAARRRRRSL